MIDAVAYLATAVVLITYKIGGRAFDWANAICSVPIATTALLHHNYVGVIISGFFGLIGIWRLYGTPR